MRDITTISGSEIVAQMNDLYLQGISNDKDVKHFAFVFQNWLDDIYEALYVLQDKEGAKALLSLNKTNYLGKKTRCLLKAMGLKEPKTLEQLIETLSQNIEREMGPY
jgi:hypothetical protein